MIVLAIDTANDFGSLALSYGDETLEEVSLHAPDGFSGILFDQIGRILKRNALTLPQVDIYSVGTGPGSFTGIRIGLSAAKALSIVADKPCYGISNLAAMLNLGSARNRAAILDARRGEIYGAAAGVEQVIPFSPWLASISPDTNEFLAFDFTPFEAALSNSPFAHVPRTKVPRALAASMAEMTIEMFRAGLRGDPALLDANYVRRTDAELLWREPTF